tara:strand:+ start:10957 stop:11388 length:432 start_codon:yes stop_codon:yes gene_type:complete
LNKSPQSRISWEEYALNLAHTAALRSEDPYRQVGACALGEGNLVLGLGYNGLASGKDVEEDFWNDRDNRRKYMIHAEANCLSLLKRGEAKLIAVTLLPCSYCATLIASHGIKKVIYSEEYERDSQSKEIFNFYKIELKRYERK